MLFFRHVTEQLKEDHVKIQLLIITLSFLNLFANSQTIMDVARSNNITFYGIDFSNAKFSDFERYIKGTDTKENFATTLKESYITYWSNYTAKANFQKYYKQIKINPEISQSEKRNELINKNDMLTNTYYEISPEKIKSIISEYNISGSGYGLLYIVESFDNYAQKIYIHVCYIKQSDKSIIATRRYIGRTDGKGIENFYAYGITHIIKQSSEDLLRYQHSKTRRKEYH